MGDSLSSIDMFGGLSIDSRTRLADLLKPCRCLAGSEIFGALDVGASKCYLKQRRQSTGR